MSDLDRAREIIDQIERLLAELNHISSINDLLQEADYAHILQLINSLQQMRRAREILFALARVNFRNEYYRFERAIDGDTIVVIPPSELREWLKDIHIRLYGLETPELWEVEGKEYRQHLENLCSIDAKGKLFVVWERERMGVHYENFPLSSFERGIGHVFFQADENNLVYVNGIMHLLKSSSLRRKGKLLLRGGSHFDQLVLRPFYTGTCQTALSSFFEEEPNVEEQPKQRRSQTWQLIDELHPPVCMLVFPKSEILGADVNTEKQLSALLSSFENKHCPFTSISGYFNRFENEILSRKMSPFDFPLLLISQWSMQQGSPNF